MSRIDRLYSATDQRKFFVPCPRCASAITLEFEQLRFEAGVAVYRCQTCGEDIAERDKLPMLEAGAWRATATGEPETRGYYLSQLYSPWTSWRDLLRRHEAAKGVPEKERVFQNTCLGLAWSPPALEVPEAETLMARAEPYQEGTVPSGAAFLTCGCDVQLDRLEIEIVAWGKDFESWSVAYRVLNGYIDQPEVWQRLDELLSQDWPHVSGMPLKLQAVCVDCGFQPAEVTRLRFTRGFATATLYLRDERIVERVRETDLAAPGDVGQKQNADLRDISRRSEILRCESPANRHAGRGLYAFCADARTDMV